VHLKYNNPIETIITFQGRTEAYIITTFIVLKYIKLLFVGYRHTLYHSEYS
jgi:hypothetical protein